MRAYSRLLETLLNWFKMRRKHQLTNKRKTRIFIIIVIQLFILCLPVLNVYNAISDGIEDGQAQAEEKLNESIYEQLDELDLEALQNYIDSLGNFSDESVGERLMAYIKGEKFDYSQFGIELLRILTENVRKILPAFACIAAVTLLSGLISTFRSGTNANMKA